MTDKCRACGFLGYVVSGMNPVPEPGSAQASKGYHIVGGRDCLERQLAQAKAVCAAMGAELDAQASAMETLAAAPAMTEFRAEFYQLGHALRNRPANPGQCILDHLAQAKAENEQHKGLADIVYERAPSLRKEGAENFDGYFEHLDEVFRRLQAAWRENPPTGYDQTPWELLTRLIDERDEARAIVDRLRDAKLGQAPWEDGADIVLLNGKPIGGTVTRQPKEFLSWWPAVRRELLGEAAEVAQQEKTNG